MSTSTPRKFKKGDKVTLNHSQKSYNCKVVYAGRNIKGDPLYGLGSPSFCVPVYRTQKQLEAQNV